jgi:hypothetical protein
MPDQADELATFDAEIEILDDDRRPFRRVVVFVTFESIR